VCRPAYCSRDRAARPRRRRNNSNDDAVMTEYAWFDKGDGRQVYRRVSDAKVQRSSLACPTVVSDYMAPTRSMVTGKMHDSKASLRAEYAGNNSTGERFTEIGNEVQKPKQRKDTRQEVRAAVRTAASRVGIPV